MIDVIQRLFIVLKLVTSHRFLQRPKEWEVFGL